MSTDDALTQAEALLARLEDARRRLEETDDPERALDVLQELADLSKEVDAALQRARDAAQTDAADT
jgi:hypothetical protein